MCILHYKTTALALCYLIAEYAVTVWSRSIYADILDPELNKACRAITESLKPTYVEDLYLLAGIGPPDIRIYIYIYIYRYFHANVQCNKWQRRSRDKSRMGMVILNEEPAKGYNITWSNMCGMDAENTTYMLQCFLLKHPCTLDDLLKFNDIGYQCTEQWKRKV